MTDASDQEEVKATTEASLSPPEETPTETNDDAATASTGAAASTAETGATSTGSVANSNGTASPKTSPTKPPPHYMHPPPPGHPMYYPYPPYDPAAYAAAAGPSEAMKDGGSPGAKSASAENGSPASGASKAGTTSPGSSPSKAPVYPPPPPHYMAQYPYPMYPGYPPPPPHHHSGYPPPPPHPHHPGYPPHYDPYAAAAHAHAYAAKSPPKGSEKSPHGSPTAATPGPYRFSDTTLRRDALARLGSNGKSKGGTPGSSPSKGTDSLDGSPQSGVHPYDVMDLEARADGATSPSQIEDFHREEVTSMGCTCKKTKCLKLYCQCFGVKIYCGHNCRCLSCHNLPQYDHERETAIRIILTRNPNAFETKFQKNNALAALRNQDEARRQPGSLPMPARVLSHKLGCKCRKSACMKKYCECYAGNVKCSSNCRCTGCKNLPLPGSDDQSPPGAAASAKKDAGWKEAAAYSLAFLKHGATPEKPARTNSSDKSEAGSMPSLASESSPSRANGAQKLPPPSTTERAAVNALESSEKTAVNALLMAARAMVGGGNDAQGGTKRGLQNAGEGESSHGAVTPTVRNGTNDNCATPDTSIAMDEEQYETPQKNLLHKFTSPKRKARETREESNDHGDPDHSSDNTQSVELKSKRSRIGSLRKGPADNIGENAGEDPNDAGGASAELSTPAKGTSSAVADLTPVSARCIDFKKMAVTDSAAV
ncbi:MAG: hypothetical protein SGILL_002855 [Bacillariaceae sp.]